MTALLAALMHCSFWAFMVKVRFWLQFSVGRAHIPSDVELHSNVWTAPWLFVVVMTYPSAPAVFSNITHAEFVRQSISTSDNWGTQGTKSKERIMKFPSVQNSLVLDFSVIFSVHHKIWVISSINIDRFYLIFNLNKHTCICLRKISELAPKQKE